MEFGPKEREYNYEKAIKRQQYKVCRLFCIPRTMESAKISRFHKRYEEKSVPKLSVFKLKFELLMTLPARGGFNDVSGKVVAEETTGAGGRGVAVGQEEVGRGPQRGQRRS